MTEYLFICNLYLIARVFIYYSGERPTPKRTLIPILINSLLLWIIFSPSMRLLSISGITLIWAALSILFEPPIGPDITDRRRFSARLILVALALSALAVGIQPLQTRPIYCGGWTWIEHHLLIGQALSRIKGQRVSAWLLSVLMCTGEANGALRYILSKFEIHPPHLIGDVGHYKQGGRIGALERILVMIFVANNAFNAVGFILTAKGLVRFGELADHKEAEYVLVGTLVSTLLAIVVGLLVPHLAG